jgi:hypothetical protein
MGWNKLLNAIKEEVNESAPIIKKKPKEKILFEKIAHEVLDDKLDEIDVKAAAQSTVKQISGVLRKGWQALKNKIKEVASIGFRLGVAVGKLFNGKYVLFTKHGEIITPPADDAKIKKIASGKKPIALTYKSKAGPMDCPMSDKLNRGFGTQITKDGDGVFFVIAPQMAGIKEGVHYSARELLVEAEKEDISTMGEIDKLVFDSFTGRGAEALKSTSEKPPKIAPVEVTYEDFRAELLSLLNRVKEGKVLKDSTIKVLAIYAPTGWGKTKIIGDLAKEAGYHYFPLELQKVDINIIQGFPYLEDAEAADDDTKEDRLRRATKVVKMAPSEFLPPTGHPDNWLLFFDEFNRADTEKMSAVMNLLLTGELGGAANMVRDKKTEQKKLDRYKLPEKVVVVLAMNTGMQKGVYDSVNQVRDLDIATLERVHRVLHGKYHATSWARSFALKPYSTTSKSGDKIWLDTRIPRIILNFIVDQMKTKTGIDPEKPFLLPVQVATGEPGMGGGERTTSPRAWTFVADQMIEKGHEQWNTLSDDAKNKYIDDAKSLMKQISEKDPEAPKDPKDYLFAAWFKAAPNQIRLAAQEAPELGDKGVEYVGKMIRSFIKKGKEGISDEDILLNYKAVREQIKKNFKNLGFGTEAQLLARLFSALSKFKTEAEVLKYMDQKSIPILSKQGVVEQLFQTFKALNKDLDFNPDDFATFTHLVDQAAKSGDNELLLKLHRKMAGKWEVYVENLKKKIQTKSQVEKELEKIGKGKKESEKPESEEENEGLKNFIKGLKL